MRFLHIEFLYFMLPPLVILFAFLLTQKESQATFFSDEVMQKLRVSANSLTLQARNGLFFLVGLLVIIALAGPVMDYAEVEVKQKSSNILLALDISDSMLAKDIYPTRLEAAKKKALAFLKKEKNERIGVIAFAQNSYLVSPLSFDHSAVAFLLQDLNTNSITEKGTNFLSMLEVVNNSTKDKQKYVVLFSDGGDKKDFSREISYAKEHNIVVFVLAVATKKGAPIRLANGEFIKQNGQIIVTKLNSAIVSLATQTGGAYIQSVASLKDVDALLGEIKKRVKQKQLQSEKIKQYFPLFYYPLGLALFIFLLATSSMSKRQSVEVPSAFLLFALLFGSTQNAQALSFLGFKQLQEAKEAYAKGEYNYAAQVYKEYAQDNHSKEAYFDAANSFYKAKKYDKALQMYEMARFNTKDKEALRYANMGNAYVKKGTKKDLLEAIQKYETSLKLKKDAEVQKNLEAVKKALEQKKKDQKQKQQDKKNQQQKQQKNNKDSKEQKKNQQNKKSQNSQGDKNKKQENKKDSQNKKNEQNKKDAQKQNAQQKQQQQKKQQDKAQNAHAKKAKPKQEQKQLQNQAFTQAKKMSDMEQKKWLKELQKKSSSYIYRLNSKPIQKGLDNEKPW